MRRVFHRRTLIPIADFHRRVKALNSSLPQIVTLTIQNPVSTITVTGVNRTLLFRHSEYQKGDPTLIKQDLIHRVVERTGLPRTKAESAVDAIFEAMKNALAQSDRIELRGFGVFNVKPRKTGVGRNPRTGAEVSIAPGKAVRFKPGKELHLLDGTTE